MLRQRMDVTTLIRTMQGRTPRESLANLARAAVCCFDRGLI